jgi:TPR repeat protein
VATYNLGVLLQARGGPEDLAEAERRYRAAAGLGHAGAMSNLGVLLQERGGPEDLAEAERRWRAAAELGHAGAMFYLGALVASRSRTETLTWWANSAENGDGEAAVNLAVVIAVNGEGEHARRLLEAAHNAGFQPAGDYLAALYGSQDQSVSARQRLRHASEGGDTDAMNYLGAAAFLDHELSVSRELWERSMAAGDVTASLLMR